MQSVKRARVGLIGLVLLSLPARGCSPTCVGPMDMYYNRKTLAERKIFVDEEAYERLASLCYRRSFGQWLDICKEETDTLQNTFRLQGLQYGQEVSRECHTVYMQKGYQAACEFLAAKKSGKGTDHAFLPGSPSNTQKQADSMPFAAGGGVVTRQPAGECTHGSGLSDAQKMALVGKGAKNKKKEGAENTPLIETDTNAGRHCCLPDEDGCCWFVPLTRE